MDFFKFKEEIFKYAENQGFESCEVFYSSYKNTTINVFNGEVEKFQNNTLSGLSFRGLLNGKLGYSYTEKLDLSSIKNLIDSAKQNSTIITSKDEEFIFSGSENYPQIQTFYPNIENIQTEELIKKCIEMEKEVLNFHKYITSCNYCSITKVSCLTYISNTKGLSLKNKSNYLFSFLSAVAKKNQLSKSFSDSKIFFDIKDFDNISFAKNVAQNTLNLLGASSIKSDVYKTIIKNDCFADLLQVFAPNFYAENVQKGLSLLNGKMNHIIANDSVSILDNPLLPNSISSCPFDSEGVASFTKNVVQNGVLKTYLYNLKSANKDNVKSTANGFKTSYNSTISTNTTNFYIQNGTTDFNDILKQVQNGIFITSLAGLHSGANPISGDFSLLAEGFIIKNSQISTPVEQITIAANFYDVLKNISIVGNDLKFNISSIGSPTLYIGNVNISGI